MATTLKWSAFDGNSWTPAAAVGNAETTVAPALGVIEDTLCGFFAEGSELSKATFDPKGQEVTVSGLANADGNVDQVACYQDVLCWHTDKMTTSAIEVSKPTDVKPITDAEDLKGFGLSHQLYGSTYDAYERYAQLPEPKPSFPAYLGSSAGYRERWWYVYTHERNDAPCWITHLDQQMSPEQYFPNTVCGTDLTLCVYGGLLYCLHRGASMPPGDLTWTTTDGTGWSVDNRTPPFTAHFAPALAAYRGRMYCLFASD